MINLVNRTRGFSEEAEKEILGNIIYQMSTSSRPCAGTVPDVTWSQSSEQTHRVLINTFILQVQKLWLKKVEAYLMHMEKTVARAGADCKGTHMGISQADGTVLYHDSDGTYRTWSSFQNQELTPSGALRAKRYCGWQATEGSSLSRQFVFTSRTDEAPT